MEEIRKNSVHKVNICGRELSTSDGVHYVQDRDHSHDAAAGKDIKSIDGFFNQMDAVYMMGNVVLIKAMNLTIKYLGDDVYAEDVHPVVSVCKRNYGNDEAVVACLRSIVAIGNNESLLRRNFSEPQVDAAIILARKDIHPQDYVEAVKRNELARRVRITELLYRIHQIQITCDLDAMIAAGYAKEMSELVNWQ